KIEGVAITEDGKELTRRREPTPRHDYNGCIQLIAGLVQRSNRRPGKPVRSGFEIQDRSNRKPASAKAPTRPWSIGNLWRKSCGKRLVGKAESKTMPIVSLLPKPSTEPEQASMWYMPSSWAVARVPGLLLEAGPTTDPITMQVNGGIILCLFLISQRSPAL